MPMLLTIVIVRSYRFIFHEMALIWSHCLSLFMRFLIKDCKNEPSFINYSRVQPAISHVCIDQRFFVFFYVFFLCIIQCFVLTIFLYIAVNEYIDCLSLYDVTYMSIDVPLYKVNRTYIVKVLLIPSYTGAFDKLMLNSLFKCTQFVYFRALKEMVICDLHHFKMHEKYYNFFLCSSRCEVLLFIQIIISGNKAEWRNPFFLCNDPS